MRDRPDRRSWSPHRRASYWACTAQRACRRACSTQRRSLHSRATRDSCRSWRRELRPKRMPPYVVEGVATHPRRRTGKGTCSGGRSLHNLFQVNSRKQQHLVLHLRRRRLTPFDRNMTRNMGTRRRCWSTKSVVCNRRNLFHMHNREKTMDTAPDPHPRTRHCWPASRCWSSPRRLCDLRSAC